MDTMKLPFGRWKFRHLVFSWLAYWITLAAVKLTAPTLAIIEATRPDGKGDVSVAFGNDMLKLSVKAVGATTWEGSVTPIMLALWLAGPPIVIWAGWLFATSKARRAEREREQAMLAGVDEFARSEASTVRTPADGVRRPG